MTTHLSRVANFSLQSAGGYSLKTNTSRVLLRFDLEGAPPLPAGCHWKYVIGLSGHPYKVTQMSLPRHGTAIPVRGIEVIAELMPGENQMNAIALDMPGNACLGNVTHTFSVPGGGGLPFAGSGP